MIRFDSVTKVYRGASKPALNGVSLEVGSGEFVFLVGASGSGKSSLLRLMLREEKPTSGEIHVLGQRLTSISSRKVPYFRRSLGVVFQDFRLLPNKTVHDNVAFTLQVIGKSRGFIQEAVPHVLSLVGLAEKAANFPHELSGGEQQRVAIARAVVNRPAILLADEPTGNLDPNTSDGIMQVLELINASGTTVVMATHDVSIVDRMQKRVVELVGGRIIRDEQRAKYVTSALPVQDVPELASDEQPGFVPVWARSTTGPVVVPSVVPNRVAGDPTTGPIRTGPVGVPRPEPRRAEPVLPEEPAAELRPAPQPPSMPAPAYEAPAQPNRPFGIPHPFAAEAPQQQPQAEQSREPAGGSQLRPDRMGLRHVPSDDVPVWARPEPAEQQDDQGWNAPRPQQRGLVRPGAGTTPIATIPPYPARGYNDDPDPATSTGSWSLEAERPEPAPPDLDDTGDPEGTIRRVGRHRVTALPQLDFVAGLRLRDSADDDEVGPSS